MDIIISNTSGVPIYEQIEEQIRETGQEACVILAGTRNDVADIMCAMDVLLFPSVFEGLPVTLIEAQAACLPVLLSETVTKDVCVTDGLITYASIDVPADVWAEQARAMMDHALAVPKHEKRVQQKEQISAHGYDMKQMCGAYQELIEKLCISG